MKDDMKEEKPSYSLVRPQGSASGLTGLMAGVLVVVVLYFARAFFIPIALSLLLTFVLAPVVLRLRKVGLGRVSSVLLAVTLSFAIMTAMGLFVSLQFLELVKKLPDYRQNIQTKLESFRVSKEGPVGRVTAMFRDLSNNNPAVSNRIEELGKAVDREPLLVTVKPAESTPVAVVSHYMRPLLGPLATAGSVVVFVIFMLLQREDLRDRILGLIGEGRLSVTTQALG